MTSGLTILAAGPGSTVQDAGRVGYLRYGVTGAGPMDPFAHALANRAVGNPAEAAAIEISLGGIELTVDGGAATVALAGGSFAVSLDGQVLPSAVVAELQPGARLKVRPGAAGAWCYLAVAGGIALPPVLGSVSTHIRTGMGGLGGRALQAGDRLPISSALPAFHEAGAIVTPMLDRPPDRIRVIPGPQDDHFAPDQMEAFLAGPWTVSPRSDRMAYFLGGPTLKHRRGHDITSDGIAMGAIQVPGSGEPIVLMADRQSTGGYPKIATIIGADLGRFAQARPGTSLSFEAVTHADAVAARAQEQAFLGGCIPVEPLVRTHFPPEFLLGLNLVDGVVDARS
ncbi:MAG: biotin-dependent carboxyltransferase family protein [Rhizobiales bacterium]|nr:biotin-dependent carboxyltransferase family protein [Hyphomicrobiales bacterium]